MEPRCFLTNPEFRAPNSMQKSFNWLSIMLLMAMPGLDSIANDCNMDHIL